MPLLLFTVAGLLPLLVLPWLAARSRTIGDRLLSAIATRCGLAAPLLLLPGLALAAPFLLMETLCEAAGMKRALAQVLDARSREKVAIFTLRPRKWHLTVVDFSPALIRDAIQAGKADAARASFERQYGEPRFIDPQAVSR